METGSELLLRDDGRFQWYLVVGALDLFAEGDWTATNDTVLLTAHKSEAVPSPAFETLTLRVDDIDFWWKRGVDAGMEIVTPVEVMFWGDRYGQYRDPFGFLWALVSAVK